VIFYLKINLVVITLSKYSARIALNISNY